MLGLDDDDDDDDENYIEGRGDHAHAQPHQNLKKCSIHNENRYLEHICAANPKMIVPTARYKGVGQDLETVANDEKIQLPTTVYVTNIEDVG